MPTVARAVEELAAIGRWIAGNPWRGEGGAGTAGEAPTDDSRIPTVAGIQRRRLEAGVCEWIVDGCGEGRVAGSEGQSKGQEEVFFVRFFELSSAGVISCRKNRQQRADARRCGLPHWHTAQNSIRVLRHPFGCVCAARRRVVGPDRALRAVRKKRTAWADSPPQNPCLLYSLFC